MTKSDYICPACLRGNCGEDPDACTSRRCTCCGDQPEQPAR